MTDHDPLAPIEALADEWERDWHNAVDRGRTATGFEARFGASRHLRAALTGAREAVDALATERDRLREALDHNVARIEDMRATLSMVADRLDEFTYDELRSVLDDDPLDQWGEIYKSRLTEAREALARVEALARGPQPTHGAAVTEGYMRCQGDVLDALRSATGKEVGQ